jgi:hypothetical protein
LIRRWAFAIVIPSFAAISGIENPDLARARSSSASPFGVESVEELSAVEK